MKLAVDKLCYVFSHALDIIEEEQIGASEKHSMRVAALSAAMGKKLGLERDALCALSVCALFHDNALTEHNLSQLSGADWARKLEMHCEKGQINVESWLPFEADVAGFILYHHERGDRSGPFGKSEGEYPFQAALIAAADLLDVQNHLQRIPASGHGALRDKIDRQALSLSTRPAIDLLLDVLDAEMLDRLRDENIEGTIQESIPRWEMDIDDARLLGLACFVARVIDFKSEFTYKHTSQIANRAWVMANHYGYTPEDQAALFLAASLHDIGKIATPLTVLEKPGALTPEEFLIIKQHAKQTREWLALVPGLEPLASWASDHHEKLNGTGYSLGRTWETLDFNSRLVACLDIYQAVSETRPYHRARNHFETMNVLQHMVSMGSIDAKIVNDLDSVMAEYNLNEVPSPVCDPSGMYSET